MPGPFYAARFWIVANLAGAALYLWFASRTWIEPQLRGEIVARGGDAMVWGTTALPLLAGFVASHLVWLGVIIGQRRQTTVLRSIWPLLTVCAIWIAAFRIDFAMQ